ncbi:hypothetical protein [Streptomyces sp. NPDC126514]|uniref:hypothetical protein n=1 Tax=Streptomyces sp. NPDC126514 TaxID=3155210 RepID=UPI0033273EA6
MSNRRTTWSASGSADVETLSFSALIAPGSNPAFYDTLVELFNAVMGTFRWAYA